MSEKYKEEKINTEKVSADGVSKETFFPAEEDLKSTVKEYFVKKGIDAPPIALTVFYGEHGSSEDAQSLEEHIANSDLFIPECIGWNEDLRTIFNKVSFGECTPEEALKETKEIAQKKRGKVVLIENNRFYVALLETLYNKRKPIAFIDLPTENPLYKSIANGIGTLFKIPRTNKVFEEALSATTKAWKEFSLLQQEREKYMLDKLGPKLEEVMTEHPDLKKQDKIRTFLFLGAIHTPFYHTLKGRGENIERKFIRKPFLYDIGRFELYRRYNFGKEVSDEIIVVALLETMLLDKFDAFLNKLPYLKRNEFINQITEQFDKEEVRDIFNNFQKKNGSEFSQYMLSLIKNKNIELPDLKTGDKS